MVDEDSGQRTGCAVRSIYNGAAVALGNARCAVCRLRDLEPGVAGRREIAKLIELLDEEARRSQKIRVSDRSSAVKIGKDAGKTVYAAHPGRIEGGSEEAEPASGCDAVYGADGSLLPAADGIRARA